MNSVNIFRGLFLLVLLSACSPTELIKEDQFYERESPAIFVSDSPLNVAYFKKLAKEAGIAYQTTSGGNYAAVIPKESRALKAIAREAAEAEFEPQVKRVQQTCATRKLHGFLRAENLLFAVARDDEAYYLIMDSKDFSAERIEERLQDYRKECDMEKAARDAREKAEGY